MMPQNSLFRVARAVAVVACVLLPSVSRAEVPHHDPQIDPYVEFLGHQASSAKDYVLGLFKDHDLVVLCERDHRDTTQYGLILSILRDERFIRDVGNVFVEVGTSALNPSLNAFLHSDGLPPDSVDRAILNFHRNCTWTYIWEKTNFSLFLRGIYEINRQLPVENKLSVYPADIPFDWSQMDSARYAEFQNVLSDRDSIMAVQVIDQFARLVRTDAKTEKALIIMNYRHAFNRHFPRPSGGIAHNFGGYLADKFGVRVANVYINYARFMMGSTDKELSLAAIQDGKWDAAFKAAGRHDADFDFKGSPFGEDNFDIWPYTNHSFRYEDIFTGFVYYLPPNEIRAVVGIPGIIDSAFFPEFLHRVWLQRAVQGQPTDFSRSQADWEHAYNIEQPAEIPDLDSIMAKINKWLP